LALLGSSPTALTLSDSYKMKLPPLIDSSSDSISVSRARLIAVLYWLGLLTAENEGNRIVAIIDQLWTETNEYEENSRMAVDMPDGQNRIHDGIDLESSNNDDKVQLGSLKWILYGMPSLIPSRFPKFCTPCAKPEIKPFQKDHPVSKSGMRREHGELVRHDIFGCPLCKGAIGCPGHLTEDVRDEKGGLSRIVMGQSEEEGDDIDYIEVAPEITILRES